MKIIHRFKREKNGRKKKYMNIHLYFSIILMVDFLVVMLISVILLNVIEKLLNIRVDVPPIVALIVISMSMGSLIAVLLGKLFLNPFRELSRAMNMVSEGDFNVRLETKSKLREVRESYSNFNSMTKAIGDIEIVQNDFVSNVSHEFKTPLAAIEGYVMLLQGSNLTENEKEQYVERILFNTNRLSDLVGNILLLSKVENRSVSNRQTTFRLDEQIRKAILLLEPKWEEKNVEFDVDMEDINYYSTENVLLHVWTNLISNAIKFGPNDGVIKIRLYKELDKIIFTIEDNGSGINEAEKSHLFDKFYQSDSSHKEEGNGLGLALVKRIVEFEEGEIDVINVPSGGCKFTVKLFSIENESDRR